MAVGFQPKAAADACRVAALGVKTGESAHSQLRNSEWKVWNGNQTLVPPGFYAIYATAGSSRLAGKR